MKTFSITFSGIEDYYKMADFVWNKHTSTGTVARILATRILVGTVLTRVDVLVFLHLKHFSRAALQQDAAAA